MTAIKIPVSSDITELNLSQYHSQSKWHLRLLSTPQEEGKLETNAFNLVINIYTDHTIFLGYYIFNSIIFN